MAEEKKDQVKDTVKELNKKYGESSVFMTDKKNVDRVKIESIPTGSISLDKVFGCGGLPRGRIVEVFGQESSGKSTLALFIAAQVQKSGGKVTWIDAEFAFSEKYARDIGVDVEKLLISQPDYGEAALDIVDKMAATREMDLIVLDSVAALIPKKELEGEITDAEMAQMARMMSKAMRMLAGNLAKTKTAVIFINQVREKIGVFWGKKTTTPGGKALKFFASVRLEVRKGKNIVNASKDVIGNWMHIVGVKNKVGLPFKEAEFELIYEHGVDTLGETMDHAVEEGIIKHSGNTFTYKETKLGVGREQAKKYLEEHEDVYLDIEKNLNIK